MTTDSEEVLKRTRLTLKFREWAIHIDQDDDIDELQRHLHWYGGYGIGHVGVIERSDGRQFSLAEVYDLLSCLVRFLTFARGLWCAPIVLEGLDGRGNVSWVDWESRPFASDWQDVHSWFPLENAAGAGKVFSGFAALWSDPNWTAVLRETVYWYAAANMNAGAIEGGMLLAHATLERLAWTHLVVDRKTYSRALWYVELALLALCRYDGKYVTRIHRPGAFRDAATVMVPWRRSKKQRATP